MDTRSDGPAGDGGGVERALAGLTRRQLAVAELAAQGLTGKEIARRLGVTAATVRNHLYDIYDRLGVDTRGELGLLLVWLGYVDIEQVGPQVATRCARRAVINQAMTAGSNV